MWCESCGYGSEVCKLKDKCPQCGGRTFENSSPVPRKPLRSSRDMKKRVRVEKDVKTKKPISDEVSQVIKEAGSLK
jgi:hypothetical protein